MTNIVAVTDPANEHPNVSKFVGTSRLPGGSATAIHSLTRLTLSRTI